MFVDLSNEAGLQRLAWLTIAPKRRQAAPGLNLEGVCMNKECTAPKQLVIMQMGFGVFDVLLVSSADTTYCPCCFEFVRIQPVRNEVGRTQRYGSIARLAELS